jgi:tetratricopeptide (TPR) repeat protein
MMGRVVTALVTISLTAAGSVTAQQWSWPDQGENLQVLPSDFSGQRIRSVMTGFTRALGVRCSHCHVGEEGQPLASYDFPSDDNPNKERARTMLRMLGDINETLRTIEPSGPERVNLWCHTCRLGRARPMTLAPEPREVYQADGMEEAIARYRGLRERFYGRGSYDFGEGTLNGFGYAVMGEGDIEAAIDVFRLNVELFPGSGNVYDSLAEAYMNHGDAELAIRYYEKSLEIDPANDNAREKLGELRAAGG